MASPDWLKQLPQATVPSPLSEAFADLDCDARTQDGEDLLAGVRALAPVVQIRTPKRQPPPEDLDEAIANLSSLLSATDAPSSKAPAVAKIAQTVAAIDGIAVDIESFRASWGTEPPPYRRDRFAVGRDALGMFPTGCVSGIYAPGSHFKTTLSCLLMLCIAAGAPFAGLETTAGASLFVSLEDGAEECHRRLGAMATTAFTEALHDKLTERVKVLVLTGQAFARFTERYTFGSSMGRTRFADLLIASAKAHAEQCGVPVRLIVIDHARLAGGGDLNDSEAATLLMRELSRLAAETGAAVVLLGHSPKSSLSAHRSEEFTAADALGSGAMVDNARFAAVVFGLTETERKRYGLAPDAAKHLLALRVIKSNYSEAGRAYYFRKTPVPGWGVAIPEFVNLQPPAPAPKGDDVLDQRVLAYIAGRPGVLTVNKLCKDYAGVDGPLEAGRPAIAAALDRLIGAGRIATREPTPNERQLGNLSGRMKEVLYVPK